MKVAIVKSSDLGNRWDAGFHIALDEVRDRVAVLKTMLTVQEARKRLAKFSLTDKKPLLVLARGTNRHLNSVTISKIVEEYPHLSLAITEQNLQPAIDRVRAKIEEDQAAHDALLPQIGRAHEVN